MLRRVVIVMIPAPELGPPDRSRLQRPARRFVFRPSSQPMKPLRPGNRTREDMHMNACIPDGCMMSLALDYNLPSSSPPAALAISTLNFSRLAFFSAALSRGGPLRLLLPSCSSSSDSEFPCVVSMNLP